MPAEQALDGSGRAQDLGRGLALRAPGLLGVVTLHERRVPGTRGPELATPALDAALTRNGLADVHTLEIRARRAPPAAGAALRGGADREVIALDVPAPAPGTEQVVLAIDEGGVMTWHHAERGPDAGGGAGAAGATPDGGAAGGSASPGVSAGGSAGASAGAASAMRGASGTRRFLVRGHVPATPSGPPGASPPGASPSAPPAPSGASPSAPSPAAGAPPQAGPGASGRQRGLIGVAGRKILKVLVYKLADPLLGELSERFVERWEGKHRAPRLRRVTPDDMASADVPALSGDDLRPFGAGRALLFVHGTFSTTHAAFGALPRATLEELRRRYGGRLFAFDHPSLSVDPAANARWLLAQIPADVRLDVDIVAHSRGGLVARCLAERGHERAARDGGGRTDDGARSEGGGHADRSARGSGGALAVGRVVLVGVPNAGTVLANSEHVPALLDRVSTLLNLDPLGVIGDVLDAVLTVVKVVGRIGLTRLDGLAAMDPQGAFVRRLNDSAPAGSASTAEPLYHAVCSNYEPPRGALFDFVRDVAVNAAMDRVFESAANDLVVPTDGVHAKNGARNFPVPAERCLQFPTTAGVTHGGYFARPETSERLLQWLPGA